jgi:tRNA 2-selenouridine synthase SelU
VVEQKKLEWNEKIKLDSDRLVELFVQLGETGAQDVVCRAMEELATRLCQLEREYQARKFKSLCKLAKGIIGIAEQVGMQRLADVARDVQQCAKRYDYVALDATLARLLRIGDSSLTAVWDLQDLSV